MKTFQKGICVAAAASSLVLSGCETAGQTGALIGAAVGAVAGNQVNDKQGKYVGAAVGALAGYAVGNYMDRQEREMRERLAQEAATSDLRIVRLPNGALQVGLAGDATFDYNSAAIRSQSQSTFAKIARVLNDFEKTTVFVIGHTDSRGSQQYNQGLSERRASTVRNFLASQGVPRNRMIAEGRGEGYPVASNATDEGRRRNRRVDIIIQPIVQGREQEAYRAPRDQYWR